MRDTLASILDSHEVSVERFIALLEEEQALLSAQETDAQAMSNVTERKSALAAELESLDGRRRALIASAGYDTDRAGSARFAREHGCTQRWSNLLALIESARVTNEINGMLIRNRLDVTNRTLAFFARARGDTLYGPNGRTHTSQPRTGLRGGV